jgi:hypothetical protein
MQFMSLAGWCSILGMIIVFIAGDTPCAPIGHDLDSVAMDGSIE